jgi:hypothetical protein
MMARSVRPIISVAMLLLLCGHGGEAGPSSTRKRNLRGSLFPEFMKGLEVIAAVSDGSMDDEMCHGRPRNRSLAWGHDEAWYHQCHLHLSQADTQAPSGQWTMSEFTDFLQLHIHTKFKQLPLSFKMIFNELSCRCLQYDHENSDCCLGGKARLAPDIGVDDTTWMSTICNRVDHAIDEVCRRQQVHRSEL